MAEFRYIVNDVEQALQFYVHVLVFNLMQKFGPAMAIVIVVKDDLSLWLAGPLSSAAQPMPDGSRPQPGGWWRIVLKVEDIEGNVVRLSEAGARFRSGIVQGPGGQALFEDPSGNAIELFQAK
jgi:predicted enzyme related to lactoylglutathione lyase